MGIEGLARQDHQDSHHSNMMKNWDETIPWRQVVFESTNATINQNYDGKNDEEENSLSGKVLFKF
jgi:hypothetical protein